MNSGNKFRIFLENDSTHAPHTKQINIIGIISIVSMCKSIDAKANSNSAEQ